MALLHLFNILNCVKLFTIKSVHSFSSVSTIKSVHSFSSVSYTCICMFFIAFLKNFLIFGM